MKKILSILIMGVVVATGLGAVALPTQHIDQKQFPSLGGFNTPGDLLISDQFNNRVIETTPDGTIVWQFGNGPNDYNATSPIGVNDAQRIGELTLVAGTSIPPGVVPKYPDGVVDNRVMLVSPDKQIIWQYGQFGVTGSGPNELNTPVQSTWLPNHHVLITDQGNNRIIEVNMQKIIVWQYPDGNHNPNDQLSSPNSAELLKNGRILISDEGNNRVIEVTRGHHIVQTFTAGGTLGAAAFASRLPNGDTLITDAGNNRAVEVDANDNLVWQNYTNTEPNSLTDPAPSRAIRLSNGDTLISDQFNNRVIRIDTAGTILAYYGLPLNNGANIGYDTTTTQNGLYAPYDAKIVGDYTGLTPPFNWGNH